jgi:hypothetical protein
MLDARCWSKIPSLAGIKIFPFTVPGNIINLFYGLFRKIKKMKKFLISFPLKTGFPLRYNKNPETSIQYHVVSSSNHCRFQKLGSRFTILAYIDA